MANYIEINTSIGKTSIVALGQAGFLIQSRSGQRLAIDPYLSDCVERVEPNHIAYKRLQPKLFDPAKMDLDVLICTHFHRDHFDIDSVPAIMENQKTKLFCPKDCEPDIVDESIDRSRTGIVSPGENVIVGAFTIHFINCDHGQGAPLAVGAVVEVDGFRILEVGDTCLRLDRKEEYLSFGPLDVLIAPINGMYGNMSEADCVALADALKPKLTIPCHYGMFAGHHGDPGRFQELVAKTTHPYLLMAMGEEYTL